MDYSVTRRDALRTGAIALTAALLPGVSEASGATTSLASGTGSLLDPVTATAAAVSAAYLKLDTLKGEAIDKDHRDWIEVLSWTWSLSQPGIRMVAGTPISTDPRATFQPLTIYKLTDKASPVLFRACARAQRFKQALLHVVLTPSGGEKTLLVAYTLTGVIANSYRSAADSAGLDAPALSPGTASPGRPVESVSLAYNRAEMSYWPVNPDGSPASAVQAGFDVATNKPLGS